MKEIKKLLYTLCVGFILLWFITGCTVSPPVILPDQSGIFFVDPGMQEHRLFYLSLKPDASPELVYMPRTGQPPHILALTPSPDSKSLAFITLLEKDIDVAGQKIDRIIKVAKIHIYNIEERSEKIIGQMNIESDAVFALNISFSPDGNHLYTIGKYNGVYQVLLMDINTRQIKPVVSSNGNEIFPVISPDGKKLIYYASDSPQKNSYKMRIFDIEKELDKVIYMAEDIISIEDNKDKPYFDVLRPVFSPSGNKLAFVKARSYKDSQYNVVKEAKIVILNLLDGSYKDIPNNNSIDISPVFISEDMLAFTDYKAGKERIMFYDGIKVTELLPEKIRTDDDRMPAYSSKHHLLVYRSEESGPGTITLFNLQIHEVNRYPVALETLNALKPDEKDILYYRLKASQDFEDGVYNYDKKRYFAAHRLFENIINNKSDNVYRYMAESYIKYTKSRGVKK